MDLSLQPQLRSEQAVLAVVEADIPLRGRALRFVLVDELRQRTTMTVAEMVSVMAGYGFDLGGRPSKVISDALRWERARNRVTRLQRGVYRYHHAPASTQRRIRIFAARCRAWIVATTRNQPPPPTPPSRRPRRLANRTHAATQTHVADRTNELTRPPWQHLGWLWTT